MAPKQPAESVEPLRQLARIAESFDSQVRLLFQLQNYISLARYNPAVAKRDKTLEFRRFVTASNLDLWDMLNAKCDTRKSSKRVQYTRKEAEDLQAELRKQQQAARSNRAPRNSETTTPRPAKPAATRPEKPQKSANRPSKRSARSQQEPPETSVAEDLWRIDSDLYRPDQPPPGKRVRHNPPITHPLHHVKPAFHGNIGALLDSYRTLTDDQEAVTDEVWQKKVETDALAVLRIHRARVSGQLGELEAEGVGTRREIPKFTPPVPAEPSFYDNMLAQGVHYAKLRANLRKFHQSILKRNSQSVDQYFRRLMGAEDRERKELERQIKQVARRTGQEVMKKWKLAQRIVEQRREAQLAEEKREKGKEYLNQILDNSAKLIESRLGDPGSASNDPSEEDIVSDKDDSDQIQGSASEGNSDDDGSQNDDAGLTVEELREKYRNMPLASESGSSESDVESDGSVSNQSDEDALEKPSEAALRLYAEVEAESGEESELDSDSESDSESEELDASSSEVEEYSRPPGLASLFGATIEEDSEEDAESGKSDTSSSDTSDAENQIFDGEIADGEKADTMTDSEATSTKSGSKGGVGNGHLSSAESEGKATESGVTVEADGESPAGDSESAELKHEESDNSPLPGPATSRASVDADRSPVAEDSLTIDNSTKYLSPPLTSNDAVERDDDLKNESPLEPSESTLPLADTGKQSLHRIEPPFLLRGQLREYQRNGLDWLAGLVQSGTNGILADEMGLGKTIQTIALLAWLACEKHIWGPHLIVVPTSVMLNWEMEFKRFAPGFKILTYFGTPLQRKRKRRGWNKEDTWHVCITSYQLVIQDQVMFRGKRWQFMVLDEAHNIKNFRSQRWQALLNFNAQHRLLLTGTPLQNNLVELWSLLYFLMPSTRATQMMPSGFASLDDFQEWFAKPVDQMVEEGEQADEEARRTITKLHQVLRPYLLRRLKVDVEKQMPAKYEHVVYCRLSKRQRYLYDDFMSRASTRATLESGNFMSILNCLMQLRKVCNHPDLFEVRPIVTSLAVDSGVYASYRDTIAPKFLVPSINAREGFSRTNLLFTEFEQEPKWAALARQQLGANEAMNEEVLNMERELNDDADTCPDYAHVDGWAKYALFLRRTERCHIRKRMALNNWYRTQRVPLYGVDCLNKLRVCRQPSLGVCSYGEREVLMQPILERFAFVTPTAVMLDLAETSIGSEIADRVYDDNSLSGTSKNSLFHESQVRLSIAFPDKRLLQFDCGKLQKLAILLRELISNGHRCLIFTQMTRVLDILEQFLNLHGWRYLRLDGATRVEQRQALTERFNKDANIPVFILSTRSGGLGINLTGADTVIFYDSDWNPAMDRQCQDRCHRIGQTRDVHIYRLVSEYTIESNILRKATQKTILDNVVIQEGDFTTEYFTRMSVHDILGNDAGRNTASPTLEQLDSSGPKRLEAAMAQAEDRDDQLAASAALSEARMDQEEFDDVKQLKPSDPTELVEETGDSGSRSASQAPPTPAEATADEAPNGDSKETELGDYDLTSPAIDVGHIDDWMIKAIERGDLY